MKRIILGCVALVIVLSSKAQTFRILTGLSVSKTDWSAGYYGYNDNLVSISSGFEVNYFEHKLWRINSRIGYVERGGMYKDKYSTKSYFFMNYATINTTLAFKIHTKNLDPYFSVGPRFDYLLSSSCYSSLTYYHFNKINYGFDLGLGADKSITDKFLIGLDITYSHQINDIINNLDNKGV